jgi:hypothetical protein
MYPVAAQVQDRGQIDQEAIMMKVRSLALAAALVVAGAGAQAATISWNQWASNSGGSIADPGGAITVTLSGETGSGFYTAYPSWTPAGTYADGAVVANAPTGGIVRLTGGNTNVNTLTFSRPVVDPVMSIWSLGQGGVNAQFAFIGATPVLVAGGPSAEYGGSSITVSGNTVFGSEGNGTVQFHGTYTSLSWTNPVYEYWYGMNVGIAGAVPEPETCALMLGGLAAIGAAARRRQKR